MYLIITGQIDHSKDHFEVTYFEISQHKPSLNNEVWEVDDKFFNQKNHKVMLIIYYKPYTGQIYQIELKWGEIKRLLSFETNRQENTANYDLDELQSRFLKE